MKSKLFASLILLGSFSAFCQKVDLDKFKFGVKYQIVPQENIPIEKRTFSTSSTVGMPFKSYLDEGSVNSKLRVAGWKKVEKDATVNINLDLVDFNLISSNLKEDVSETKDKDGKVTSRSYLYYVNAEFSQDGRIKITGPFSPPVLSKKEQEAIKAKEEKVATNRFLAKTNVATTPKVDLNNKIENLPSRKNYTSDKFKTSKEAVETFNTAKTSITDNQLRSFTNNGIDRANDIADYYFGFPTAYQSTDHLWILDSKSHPEYQTQQEAIQAIKTVFATMEANQPIAELAENLQPLIDYFESLKTKYKADDKWERKMRYSAFFNLSKIYYYLDRPAQAIIQAEGLIANDYDTKDGEKLKEEAQELLDLFNRTKFTSRHNIPFK